MTILPFRRKSRKLEERQLPAPLLRDIIPACGGGCPEVNPDCPVCLANTCAETGLTMVVVNDNKPGMQLAFVRDDNWPLFNQLHPTADCIGESQHGSRSVYLMQVSDGQDYGVLYDA